MSIVNFSSTVTWFKDLVIFVSWGISVKIMVSIYIMWNARLDESQAGIKIIGRNSNNLKYADDITLMAEKEEELKSL